MGNEYNFLGLSDKVKDTKGKEYVLSGYYNRDDKTMYWKTQGESFLYSGDGGKPRGYLDKHGKPHFHIPGSEDKMFGKTGDVYNDNGDVIGSKALIPDSFEDRYVESAEFPDKIFNKYFSKEEGQKAYGFSFPSQAVVYESSAKMPIEKENFINKIIGSMLENR